MTKVFTFVSLVVGILLPSIFIENIYLFVMSC
jgi:hypothetical protein